MLYTCVCHRCLTLVAYICGLWLTFVAATLHRCFTTYTGGLQLTPVALQLTPYTGGFALVAYTLHLCFCVLHLCLTFVLYTVAFVFYLCTLPLGEPQQRVAIARAFTPVLLCFLPLHLTFVLSTLAPYLCT